MSENISDIILNNKKQINILVYSLNYSIDNNKILILSEKISKENFDYKNFDVIYKTYLKNNLDINNDLDNNQYSFIFTEIKLDNSNYTLKTYFNLKKKIILESYKYYPPKLINGYCLNKNINLNIDSFYVIPDEIYNYTKNFNSSKIIWSPYHENINNDHLLIKKINEIGNNFYKRKNNLIDVVSNNDASKIKEFSNCINNNSNICIYQETNNNPLGMKNCVYMQWYFDTFNNISKSETNALYLYQFPMYSFCSNILRMKYDVPIDINSINIYPNSLPLIFNIHVIKHIRNISNNRKYVKTIESCYVLRKTSDSHPLKMMDTISDFYIHPEDSINIDSNSLEQNIETFLKCKKFYCYDNICFLPVFAALCDCTPILSNKYNGFENIRDIYKTYSPWMYYGMAYDDTEEEITFAKNTKNLLIELIEKIDNDSFLNFFSENCGNTKIIHFLKYLECYFGVSFNETNN